MLAARYHAFVQVHNELQEWLITLCSPCIQLYVNHLHNFLSMRLNMIPLQYEDMSWIQFSPLSFLHACCHLPCLLHMHHWHLYGSLLWVVEAWQIWMIWIWMICLWWGWQRPNFTSWGSWQQRRWRLHSFPISALQIYWWNYDQLCFESINIIKWNQVEHTNTKHSFLGYVWHPFVVGRNMVFQSKDQFHFVLDYCAPKILNQQSTGTLPSVCCRFKEFVCTVNSI